MITFGQVYTLIAAKFITGEETKSNTHFVQQFDRQRFQFQVEERVNTRDRHRIQETLVATETDNAFRSLDTMNQNSMPQGRETMESDLRGSKMEGVVLLRIQRKVKFY